MNGKMGMALGISAGAAVAGGLLYLAFAPVEADYSSVRDERQAERKATRKAVVSTVKTSKFTDEAGVGKEEADVAVRRPRMKMPEDWFANLPSPRDRAIAKRIQDAQDADNREAVFKAAEDALGSKNVEVRQAAVDALSLQGEAAIPSLLKFVGDENKDVADSAYHAWDDAADSLDGDLAKLGAIKEVLVVARDDEHVKSAVGKIESFDQPRAIRELAKLAQNGGIASEAAKESYENVTGESFESWAAAELKAIALDRENAENEESDLPY